MRIMTLGFRDPKSLKLKSQKNVLPPHVNRFNTSQPHSESFPMPPFDTVK